MNIIYLIFKKNLLMICEILIGLLDVKKKKEILIFEFC